jgi:integrase
MPAMPRPLPPYVQVHRRQNQTVVYYFRRNRGKRQPLPPPGSPGFEAAYAACLAGSAPAQQPAGSKAKHGTLRWLVEQWKQSSDWMTTSAATKRQRDNILAHVLEDDDAGSDPFDSFTTADIRDGRERRMATPFAADNFLKTMRALFRWAKEADHVDHNPAAAVSFINSKTDGFTPWTENDVARYRKRWPLGTRQRLALEILRNTGLRRGDAVRLGRQHVQDGIHCIKAEKTGVDLFIPILPELAAAIAAGPTGDLAYLSTEDGRPMGKEHFGNLFRRWCKAAGVKASAHGIRKLAATTVAEAGGSEMQMQSLFGWQTNAQSAVYTKAARRKALAIEAAHKMNAARPQPEPATPTRFEIKGEK